MTRALTPLPLSLALVLTLAEAAHPAPAAETPRPGAEDSRIRTIDYDPQQVVRLTGTVRTATQIRFAPEETILHVALGDSAGWEIAPEADLLFVKPTTLRAATNLIVTTQVAGGETRHYAFDLTARRATPGAPGAVFVLQFRYPKQAAAKLEAALSAEAQALEARVLQLKLDRGVLEGARNLAYDLQGSTAIAPSEVSDNGRFTVLRFPGVQAIPAIYAVNPDGTEALVPFDVRGEFLVVHLTAPQLRLRRGREVLCILNRAHRPFGAATGTGTAAPDVARTLEVPRP